MSTVDLSQGEWVQATHIVAREVSGGAMLLDMNSGNCWQINASGAALWHSLSKARSLREAIAHVATGLEEPLERVEADMRRFAEELAGAGMLVRQSAGEISET